MVNQGKRIEIRWCAAETRVVVFRGAAAIPNADLLWSATAISAKLFRLSFEASTERTEGEKERERETEEEKLYWSKRRGRTEEEHKREGERDLTITTSEVREKLGGRALQKKEGRKRDSRQFYAFVTLR